jgi:glycerol 3-phosphatase-2
LSAETLAPLSDSVEPLCQRYDVALLDLDGVVYLGPDAVPGVPAALEQARSRGMRLAFVTNNAARPPAAVAAHLNELGIRATAAEVTTSSQAAARHLSELLPAGARVLVVGTTGLIEALQERGLTPVHSADDDPAAVVQGYSPDTDWRMLAEGAIAIRRGRPWIATNLDPTVPSPRGPLPGNGSLVAALRHATGVTPVSTGKPDPTMHRESVERSGAVRPLVVGDRLDTDIEGAYRAACDSLLVFTGVTDPAALLAAVPEHRPTYLAHDASGVLRGHRAPAVTPEGVRCGTWTVDRSGRLSRNVEPGKQSTMAAGTSLDDDGLDALRALCQSKWTAGWTAAQGGDEASVDELARLGLV